MGTVEVTPSAQSAAASQEKADALSITDRRTGRVYEVPITNGTIPASAVADELKAHVESLAGAIDSLKMALVK